MAASQKFAKPKSRDSSKDTSVISVAYWMFAIFIALFPLLNLIAVPVLACAGSNQTKKNFFRAILGWLTVIILLNVALIIFGFGPGLLEVIRMTLMK
jgi:uncharacterized membrane-anchored protein YitT (DUF2179 family)